MGNLKFDEAGIQGAGTDFSNYGSYLEECITDYATMLRKVCARDIKAGTVNQALMSLQEIVAKPNGIRQIGANIALDIEDFVTDIDVADELIY